jgi:hypothetical protein
MIEMIFIWVCLRNCSPQSGKDGLRKEILEKKACTSVYGNKDKGMIVIIKPSKKSNYKM